MNISLWEQLPPGFLLMRYTRWSKLSYDVRKLIVDLAKQQSFKCALCSATRKLVVEHDHWPEYGSGEGFTIYNIRGIACRGCNWHLMVYEKDLQGEHRGFDDVSSRISDRVWGEYTFQYDCRVGALRESELRSRMGDLKYFTRRLFLDKFDDWNEWGRRHYPWRSYFAEIKERRRWIIRTPEQFWKMLAACTRFIVEEKRKNPDFEIPEQFLRIVAHVQPILEEIWPQIEERYWAIKAGKQSNLLLQAPSRK